jgi:hypothetical protein
MRRRICSIPSRRKDPGRLPVAAAGRLPTVVHEVGDRHALRDCRPVFLDSLAGYALARPHFRGRAGLSALFIGIMAVPAEVLLIPRYLVLVQLGIYNTYAGMIIPQLADAAGVFIMRQFFVSIPVEGGGVRPARRRWCVPDLQVGGVADGAGPR